MGITTENQDAVGAGSDCGKSWIDEELGKPHFKDVRLGKRFRKVLEQMFNKIGNSIPLACQDWTNTKAAYRFFSNPRVTEEEILAGHFQATGERFAALGAKVLILHDTCELSYRRNENASIGLIGRHGVGKNKDGSVKLFDDRGVLMHSSLALTPEGLPLGLCAIKFWSREEFKADKGAPKKGKAAAVAIEQKESIRWLENLRQSSALFGKPASCVHIGDRESDMYELFCAAADSGTHFVLRTCVDRPAGDHGQSVEELMKDAAIRGQHRIEGRTKTGESYRADLEVRYERLVILPPLKKQKQLPPLTLTVIHASEVGAPEGRERIEWKLITNLEVNSQAEAVEKLDWYAMRWKIETFHKILKSGCKAEESKLRTSQRLVNLISVYCILSWRIFWMTMLNRTAPEASPETVFTPTEITLLEQLYKPKPWDEPPQRSLCEYLIKVAKLGGYLARKSDPPPGNMVLWRGMSRLTDIQFGYSMALKLMGN
jgi:hypothetical protein